MGLAGLFIMICHNSFRGTITPVYEFNINYLRPIFQFGVDIFLLLSGFGLYYSYNKKPNVPLFYKRRFIRLLPSYFVCAILVVLGYVISNRLTFIECLKRYSIVGFYIFGDLGSWFIGAIIVLYLLFPLFYKLLKYNRKVFILANVILFFVSLALEYLIKNVAFNGINTVMIARIPTFSLGMILANETLSNNKKLDNVPWFLWVIINIISLILSVLILKFGLNWVYLRGAYLFLTLSFLVLMSALFDKIKLKGWLNKLLIILGTVTLETYVIHPIILEFTDSLFKNTIKYVNVAEGLSQIVAIVFAVIIGYLIHIWVEYVIKKCKIK